MIKYLSILFQLLLSSFLLLFLFSSLSNISAELAPTRRKTRKLDDQSENRKAKFRVNTAKRQMKKKEIGKEGNN